jgi:hypothetical protein
VAGGPAAIIFERTGSWLPVLHTSIVMALVATVIGAGLRLRRAHAVT